MKTNLTFLIVCLFIGLIASAQSADTSQVAQTFDRNQGEWQSYVYVGASALEIIVICYQFADSFSNTSWVLKLPFLKSLSDFSIL